MKISLPEFGRIRLTILFAVITAAWLLSGMLKSKELPDATPMANNPQTSSVRTQRMVAAEQTVEVVIRGRTEAKRTVAVRAETSGRVIATPVEKGQPVNAGDTLCEIAADGRPEKLQQARAALAKAEIDYKGTLKLKQSGYVSQSSIAASKTALETARAELRLRELDVQNLKITAPFPGVVDDRLVNVGDFIDRAQVCAVVIDQMPMLVVGQVSERDVSHIRSGTNIVATLVSGEKLTGKVVFIANAADPHTRTYRVEAELDATAQPVRSGVTAQIVVPVVVVKAHRISPSILALDDSGQVGLRTVNGNSKVEFHHVDVVRETQDGVWVTGLPDTVDVITVGQEYVTNGETVVVTKDIAVTKDNGATATP